METQEKEIIKCALGMFNKFGIRSVTMDDVAQELGISKKTIYKYFENKADLVHKSVLITYEKLQHKLEKIHAEAENSIDELIEIDKVIGVVMENHNPGMRYQLQKYYPRTYNLLYEGRHDLIHKVISENIEKGKQDGLFRKEADTQIITFLYCSKVETMPEEEQELLEKHSLKYMTRQALEYHIRGIATARGLDYLEKKLNGIRKE